MSVAERYLTLNSRDLRLELEELYAAYTACLDEERFEEWPEFFVEQCLYKIVPRENFERSEERRGGKECRSRWPPYHQKKKASPPDLCHRQHHLAQAPDHRRLVARLAA